LATLKRSQKRRYGSISRSGVFFCLLENRACDQSQTSQAANRRGGAPLAIVQDYPACELPSLPRACPKKARLFSILTCVNSLILNSILIDQMLSFDREAPYGGSAWREFPPFLSAAHQ
jgi:hypothetical protein